MRPCLLPLALLVPAMAAAVPLELSHQGRLFDSSGVALDGAHDLTVSLYATPTDTTPVWTDTFSTNVSEGHFHLLLGSGAEPFTGEEFSGDALWVGLAVDGDAEIATRNVLVSVPYAIHAGTATDVVGGVVDVQEVRIDGIVVIDSSGAFVGVGGGSDGVTLAGLDCSADETAMFDGLDWTCAELNAAHTHVGEDITSGRVSIDVLPVGDSDGTVAAGVHTHDFADITGTLSSNQLPADLGTTLGTLLGSGSVDLGSGSTVGGAPISTGAHYSDSSAVAAMGSKGAGNALNHDRYANSEAVAAMGGKGAGNPLHHDRYANSEAVAAMGSKGAGNPLNHDRYTDAAAVAAVEGASDVALTGELTAGAGIKNRSWKMVYQQSFTRAPAGWSNTARSVCGNEANYMLGGYGLFSNTDVTYTVANLPEHTEVKVALDYHFIDSWDGEKGYIRVDTTEIWSKTEVYDGGNNICGQSWGETLNYPAEGEMAHSADSFVLHVGSTLDQGPTDESFGFDNVRVWVR